MRTPDSLSPLLPDAPDERLETWLDGDLPPHEAQRVAAAVAEHAAWARAARASLRVQNALHTTPAPKAPPAFAASVMRAIEQREATNAPQVSLWERLRAALRVPVWQPALALATAVLVTVAVWSAPSPKPTAEEVAASVEDVKWTLAYLSHASEQTGLRVRDEVLAPHVVAPVQRALASSFSETSH